MQDQISDMLTRIRNGQKANLEKISLFVPTSKICLKILIILYREGYIKSFNIKKYNPLHIEVFLKYDYVGQPIIKNIQRVSTLSKRIFVKNKSIWNVKSGQGLFILSTPKGLLTLTDAKILNCGGEVLLSVY